MNSTACPHCGATDNFSNSLFCQHCHKALPIPNSAPRLVESSGRPMTMAGHTAQIEEVSAQSGKGSGALLGAAIVQFIGGALAFFTAANTPGVNAQEAQVATMIVVGLGVVFFVLYIWSHRQPLPAAIIGLSIYVLAHAVDAMADPMQLFRGLLVKIVIVTVLCRSIAAAMKERDLRRAEPVM